MTKIERYLRDYEAGETFTGFFVLRKKDMRTKRDGGAYLMLEFGDRSGRLPGIVWNDAERIFSELKVGGIIKLNGRIELYRDDFQVGIRQLRAAVPEDNVDPSGFIEVSVIDPRENLDRLLEFVDAVSNQYLNKLLLSFLEDDEFVEKLLRTPGGKHWHHNRLGGLIEHTLGVCRVCRFLGRIYPDINKDLLVTGAILHDIGKVEEFSTDTMIDYTNRGRLVGHVSIGAHEVASRAASIEGFPVELLDRLIHLILSHQDEFGSPVLPEIREAFLLHYADQIDSKMDALNRIKGGLKEDERWKFVNLLNRWIDFSDSSEVQENFTAESGEGTEDSD
ncbi:MAG: HD domain-containing protein [Candidatus Hatepunaea meridiana]|nr:HD domain-containing protein [Candidatus Hatepunaea meridiana]